MSVQERIKVLTVQAATPAHLHMLDEGNQNLNENHNKMLKPVCYSTLYPTCVKSSTMGSRWNNTEPVLFFFKYLRFRVDVQKTL